MGEKVYDKGWSFLSYACENLIKSGKDIRIGYNPQKINICKRHFALLVDTLKMIESIFKKI